MLSKSRKQTRMDETYRFIRSTLSSCNTQVAGVSLTLTQDRGRG